MDDHLDYSEFPLPDTLPDMSALSLAFSPPTDSSTMDVPVDDLSTLAFDPSFVSPDSSQFASAQFASEDSPSARLADYIQRFQASGEVPEAARRTGADPREPFACAWVDPKKGACSKAYGRDCDLT